MVSNQDNVVCDNGEQCSVFKEDLGDASKMCENGEVSWFTLVSLARHRRCISQLMKHLAWLFRLFLERLRKS